MATTATVLPSSPVLPTEVVVLVSGTTTGSAETIYTPPSGKKWVLIGWSLGNATNDSTNVLAIMDGPTDIRRGVMSNQNTTNKIASMFESNHAHRPYESAADALLKHLGTSGAGVWGQYYLHVF